MKSRYIMIGSASGFQILCRKVIKWGCFSIITLFFIFEIETLLLLKRSKNISTPPVLGNFDNNIHLLSKKFSQKEISFAVIGDTKGFSIFKRLFLKLHNEPLSFMVLLGDCVASANIYQHRFYRLKWCELLQVNFPIFYVAGNHDVDYKKFPIKVFESYYGPTNFYFSCKNSLFIVIRALPPPFSMKESIRFLKSILSAKRDLYKYVFVFMHIPPQITNEYNVRNIESRDNLIKIFDKYRVNFVVASDYHGYYRVKRNHTVYLITGGGGATLVKSKFGMFYHAIVITVGKDYISEKILTIKKNFKFVDIIDDIEWNAMTQFYPWILSHSYSFAICNVCLIFYWFFVVSRQIRIYIKLIARVIFPRVRKVGYFIKYYQ